MPGPNDPVTIIFKNNAKPSRPGLNNVRYSKAYHRRMAIKIDKWHRAKYNDIIYALPPYSFDANNNLSWSDDPEKVLVIRYNDLSTPLSTMEDAYDICKYLEKHSAYEPDGELVSLLHNNYLELYGALEDIIKEWVIDHDIKPLKEPESHVIWMHKAGLATKALTFGIVKEIDEATARYLVFIPDDEDNTKGSGKNLWLDYEMVN